MTHEDRERELLDRLDRVLGPEGGDSEPEARSLRAVVAEGDYKSSLEALRDHLAEQLHDPENAGNAALARELRQTLQSIAALGGQGLTLEDELERRRQARQSDARVSDGT